MSVNNLDTQENIDLAIQDMDEHISKASEIGHIACVDAVTLRNVLSLLNNREYLLRRLWIIDRKDINERLANGSLTIVLENRGEE